MGLWGSMGVPWGPWVVLRAPWGVLEGNDPEDARRGTQRMPRDYHPLTHMVAKLWSLRGSAGDAKPGHHGTSPARRNARSE